MSSGTCPPRNPKGSDRVRRGNLKAGFTLVELMVVLALGAVLFGIGMGSMSGYIRRTTYHRQQERAESLFMAAQLQLTQYATSGRLDAFAQESGESAVDLSRLVSRGGDAVTAGSVWGSGDARRQGTVCYLMGDAQTYEAYLDGTGTDAESALYGLLDGNVYDKSVLRAAVCVEFDPQDGLVYSVFYSDRNDSFTYGARRDGVGSICERTDEALRGQMIGYYGVSTLTKSP